MGNDYVKLSRYVIVGTKRKKQKKIKQAKLTVTATFLQTMKAHQQGQVGKIKGAGSGRHVPSNPEIASPRPQDRRRGRDHEGLAEGRLPHDRRRFGHRGGPERAHPRGGYEGGGRERLKEGKITHYAREKRCREFDELVSPLGNDITVKKDKGGTK